MATKIGIRQLVEFVLRSGDLNETKNSQNTALNGARIHRRLQKKRSKDPDYQSEVYLKTEVTMNDNEYLISGRADGLKITDKNALIEEIKTSDQPFEELSDNTLELYWGQVKVYGYLILKDYPRFDHVTLRLTYFQVSTEKIMTDEQVYSRDDLNKFFKDLINEYEYWLVLRANLRKERNTSIKKLQFPFPQFRTGQHELAAAVYKTILYETRLFVEAPTGTGKTISTLFPAIKAMGEEKIQRLFYLTAKQSTRRVAEEAIDLMASKGLKLKSITLTAKDKIRFPEQDVPPDKDPYMIGYYDRLKPALSDLLTNEDSITREVIEKYAKKHQVDPFEFSLDASLFCDVIICDYNYLFDPLVYLQRFFIEKDTDNFFLIDEAHNLVSRSRSMYSAQISDQKIASLLKAAKKINTQPSADFQKQIKKVRRVFNQMKKVLKEDDLTERITSDVPDKLLNTLSKFNDFMTDWIADQQPSDFLESAKDYFFDSLTFVKIGALYDDTYKTRIVIEDKNLIVKQLCLDPSHFLDKSLDLGLGAVFFSATLSPMDYYQSVLGGKENSLAYQLPSPFPAQNQVIMVTRYIQTTYRQRPFSQDDIVESLHTLISGKKGNYLCFFPSYGYLKQIEERFEEEYPEILTVTQTSAMNNVARDEFLNKFQDNPDHTLLGFCVLGGIFSEGIDLRGNKLIGVAVVSVGLPGLSAENNLIRDYYDQENGHGFEYAYQMPGMNNVLQAAGRLIRSSHDKGIILLLDQRFASFRYTQLFPNHWQNRQNLNSVKQLQQAVDKFWKGVSDED
ncbi:ATP-dependent DNA helicase [Companilactobacillus pabuli]|jgi:Rad3-related DNA helicase|uniref:ATP-dependent DNA helicase n=1 Tax=Companilactobacillus pabuli TaxID=2714036 RepID=A0A7L7KYA8_9LACO|nr:ATP-dependent DNA helicase [Companilactobacillus pabuli]AKP02589.1 ATP-dependent helicase [Companilactobacillus farciminis]AKS50886.1 ATP-dependent helicase [Companilactobacillus farciminis]MDG5114020.1 ATP-dependent DNA helicase [Companilactobacillus pabuli]QMT84771.1 ATP-dependent DNA helicase [Companilactobacillus pabuli]GAQ02191.1 ATP-dependent helicase [Companilactobacillus farciminis]